MQKANSITKMTNYRWTIVVLLFVATTINYLDRQVLSLTWDEFIKPEFHWNEDHYGTITSIFSFVYAFSMLFAGRFVDWLGTRKGYLWAIGVWSVGACLHALCGVVTEHWVGLGSQLFPKDVIESGNYAVITEKCATALEIIQKLRS